MPKLPTIFVIGSQQFMSSTCSEKDHRTQNLLEASVLCGNSGLFGVVTVACSQHLTPWLNHNAPPPPPSSPQPTHRLALL